eukprot:COSAG01_NODE_1241_length_11085_cov_9.712361_10_plen_175_part_00
MSSSDLASYICRVFCCPAAVKSAVSDYQRGSYSPCRLLSCHTSLLPHPCVAPPRRWMQARQSSYGGSTCTTTSTRRRAACRERLGIRQRAASRRWVRSAAAPVQPPPPPPPCCLGPAETTERQHTQSTAECSANIRMTWWFCALGDAILECTTDVRAQTVATSRLLRCRSRGPR